MNEIFAPESIIMGACMPLIVPSVTKSSSKLLIGVGKVSQEETVGKVGAGSDLLSSTFLTGLALVLVLERVDFGWVWWMKMRWSCWVGVTEWE